MTYNTENDSAMIANFLATRGATKIAASSHTMTSRDLYLAVRGERRQAIDPTTIRNVQNVNGIDYVFNGIGERIA